MAGFPSSLHNPINIIDLFAGGGGFAAGFRAFSEANPGAAEFSPVAAVEQDRAAASTYAANFGSAHVHPDDIAAFDARPFAGTVDVVVGGPPCQGFSGLGAGRPDDPRNALWKEYLRVVAEIQPKIFVLENVDRFMRSPEFGALRDATKQEGRLHDYALTSGILNSADFGVPQARRRAIVIGTRNDLPPLKHPTPSHSQLPRSSAPTAAPTLFGNEFYAPLEPWETVENVFSRSARVEIKRTDLLAHSAEILPGISVPGVYRTSDLHIGRNPEPLSLARYRAIPPGGNRYNLRGKTAIIDGREFPLSTPSWDAHRSGSADVMGRLYIDRPSVTIRTEFYKPEKGRYLHPFDNRPITHYEAALIQGFPTDYKWCGTKIQIARQIGNAVPVGLASALAAAIHHHLRP